MKRHALADGEIDVFSFDDLEAFGKAGKNVIGLVVVIQQAIPNLFLENACFVGNVEIGVDGGQPLFHCNGQRVVIGAGNRGGTDSERHQNGGDDASPASLKSLKIQYHKEPRC